MATAHPCKVGALDVPLLAAEALPEPEAAQPSMPYSTALDVSINAGATRYCCCCCGLNAVLTCLLLCCSCQSARHCTLCACHHDTTTLLPLLPCCCVVALQVLLLLVALLASQGMPAVSAADIRRTGIEDAAAATAAAPAAPAGVMRLSCAPHQPAATAMPWLYTRRRRIDAAKRGVNAYQRPTESLYLSSQCIHSSDHCMLSGTHLLADTGLCT